MALKRYRCCPGRRVVEDRVAATPAFRRVCSIYLLSGRDNFDLRCSLQLASRQVVTRPRPKVRRLLGHWQSVFPPLHHQGERVLHAERFWPNRRTAESLGAQAKLSNETLRCIFKKYGASSRAFGVGKFLPSVTQDSLLEVIQ
jgi:hypothetical protein